MTWECHLPGQIILLLLKIHLTNGDSNDWKDSRNGQEWSVGDMCAFMDFIFVKYCISSLS